MSSRTSYQRSNRTYYRFAMEEQFKTYPNFAGMKKKLQSPAGFEARSSVMKRHTRLGANRSATREIGFMEGKGKLILVSI